MSDDAARRLVLPANYPWKNLNTAVSSRDDMLPSAEHDAHYLAVGVSAAQIIHQALQLQGIVKLSSILDMPCGHGRVTRVLRATHPEADLFVCDLDRDGVAFCAQQFSATPLVSIPDFRKLDFGRQFDLIWVGSLITHLPESVTVDFIDFALRHLTPQGVAVVSSHGPFVVGRMQRNILNGGEGYGTENGAARVMLRDYFDKGYGYADYPNNDNSVQHYGISLTAPEWLKAAVVSVGGKVLLYRDHAFDRHHDIVAFAH